MRPIENQILSTLSNGEYLRLLPPQPNVTLSPGEVLYELGQPLDYVYFPTTSVVSLLCTMENGSTVEMGLVGNDGVVGVSLFLGSRSAPNQAIAIVAGHALRVKSGAFRQEFARGGPLQMLLLRYTHAFLTQVSQTAACNRLHSVQKRLCRWLLLCHDRVPSNELAMTQEFISNLLGGRRESVTIAAARLQAAGLIHYSRGHIKILDRRGLEASACECYWTVKAEVDRLQRIPSAPYLTKEGRR